MESPSTGACVILRRVSCAGARAGAVRRRACAGVVRCAAAPGADGCVLRRGRCGGLPLGSRPAPSARPAPRASARRSRPRRRETASTRRDGSTLQPTSARGALTAPQPPAAPPGGPPAVWGEFRRLGREKCAPNGESRPKRLPEPQTPPQNGCPSRRPRPEPLAEPRTPPPDADVPQTLWRPTATTSPGHDPCVGCRLRTARVPSERNARVPHRPGAVRRPGRRVLTGPGPGGSRPGSSAARSGNRGPWCRRR
ncbi:hypothetical protein QE410_000002 [Microbacterium sp. SORGH_AS 1204]|nr:hypothetical protein [Microbacterium sp. SORGH_AS_1204]